MSFITSNQAVRFPYYTTVKTDRFSILQVNFHAIRSFIDRDNIVSSFFENIQVNGKSTTLNLGVTAAVDGSVPPVAGDEVVLGLISTKMNTTYTTMRKPGKAPSL